MYQEFSQVSLKRLTNRRQGPRHAVLPDTRVSLTVLDTCYDCEVLDLSSCGARLKLDTKIPVGSVIELSHDQCGSLYGTVKWNSRHEVGLELNPGVARLLVRYSTPKGLS
ncbi:PilZ domain-containing protein [Kiloniella laminariae]|uniref:PilZ domain-containing protein n=1 Tax=Kiloniella laminariae TaxID=454162 RepID=A0ABT4LP67_9PROT|nr:PilZ domain-containing protein [Kiloniella laminariae]MCZ4282903.1 PilZ domain-containing protein [Kiloniella laminariae]